MTAKTRRQAGDRESPAKMAAEAAYEGNESEVSNTSAIAEGGPATEIEPSAEDCVGETNTTYRGCGLEQKYQDVLIANITIPTDHRPIDDAKVASLAHSILEIGLLQPVGLNANYQLIHGRHRLAAYEKLGHTSIPARILQYDDELRAELATIDENLLRNGFSKQEECQALARRKKIFESLHPETKAGKSQAAGCNRAQGKHVSDNLSPTFTEDTARKTSQSQRSVERKVEIGEKLDPRAAEMLKGTAVENNQSQLKAISQLPAKEQREVAAEIKAGKMKTVRKAKPRTVQENEDKAQEGLRLLGMLVAALKECGIYEDFADSLLEIKKSLENYSDEETAEWRG